MFEMLPSVLTSFRAHFQSRADLQIEILALRHQIVAATADSQAQTQPGRSAILGRSIPILASMAFGALDSEIRHRYRLATSGFPLVLDLEGSTWTPWTAMRTEGGTRINSVVEPRQYRLGSAKNSQ